MKMKKILTLILIAISLSSFGLIYAFIYVEDKPYQVRLMWMAELEEVYGLEVQDNDAHDRQDGLDWYYDFGHGLVALEYEWEGKTYYGAFPRSTANYIPRYNRGRFDHYLYHQLVLYEDGFYFANSALYGGERTEHTGYYHRVNGQFFAVDDESNLGEVLHRYNFDDPVDLLSQANKDVIARVSAWEEDIRPSYGVGFKIADGNRSGHIRRVRNIVQHPSLPGSFVLQVSNSHHFYFMSEHSLYDNTLSSRARYSRTGAYYRYDSTAKQLYLMDIEEVVALGLGIEKNRGFERLLWADKAKFMDDKTIKKLMQEQERLKK
jgi:hypothetical protein